MEDGARRKHPRLSEYDYRQNGGYFVTTNVRYNRCILADVVRPAVGRGLAPAEVRLTQLGQIAREQILLLPERYPFVTVDKFVVMPNHIHMILRFHGDTAGASPRPTLMQVVGAVKSLTARKCNQMRGTPGEKFWQESFYESVLRNDEAYLSAWRYIDENPAKWAEDSYYVP